MYKLNGHITTKQALPDDRARQHKYYAHYYPLPCGDVYLVTPKGEIKAVLSGRDDSILIWCPPAGLYPHYWKPSTTMFSTTANPDACPTCIDQNTNRNLFGSPMTDDTPNAVPRMLPASSAWFCRP